MLLPQRFPIHCQNSHMRSDTDRATSSKNLFLTSVCSLTSNEHKHKKHEHRSTSSKHFFLTSSFCSLTSRVCCNRLLPAELLFLFLLHASHHSQTKSVSCCKRNTWKHTSTYKLTQDSVQAKYWKAWLLLDLCSFGGEQWEVLNERESLIASLTFAERFTDQLELNHCQVWNEISWIFQCWRILRYNWFYMKW